MRTHAARRSYAGTPLQVSGTSPPVAQSVNVAAALAAWSAGIFDPSALDALSMDPAWWEDDNNTGIPPGTSLTSWAGTLTTSSNGQVIDARTGGQITDNHTGVTVQNTRATTGIRVNNGPLTIVRSDLGPDSGKGGGVSGSGVVVQIFNDAWPITIENSRVHNCNDEVHPGEFHAVDTWFHWIDDVNSGSHSDLVQHEAPGGVTNDVLTHCRFTNDGPSRFTGLNWTGDGSIIIEDCLFDTVEGSTNTVTHAMFFGGNGDITVRRCKVKSGVFGDVAAIGTGSPTFLEWDVVDENGNPYSAP